MFSVFSVVKEFPGLIRGGFHLEYKPEKIVESDPVRSYPVSIRVHLWLNLPHCRRFFHNDFS